MRYLFTLLFVSAILGCSSVPEEYRGVSAWLEVEGVNDGLDMVRGDLPKLSALMEAVCRALPDDSGAVRMRQYGRLGFPIDTMLADAARGGTFQCNDRVWLFTRAATLLGYRARVCPMRRSDGEGHQVAEVWLKDQWRWCTFGLMAEEYYMVDGEPAASITLARIAQNARVHRDSLSVVTSSNPAMPFDSLAPFFLGVRMAAFEPFGEEWRAIRYTPIYSTPMLPTADSALIHCDGYRWFIWPQDVDGGRP